MSSRNPNKIPDVDFECEQCEDTFKLKQLNVKEREDKLTYSCPVCNNELYETALNRPDPTQQHKSQK